MFLFPHSVVCVGMSGIDTEKTTRELWQIYTGLHTTKWLFNAFVGNSAYRPLRIIAVGKQGSGKTTFMYYATKVAYVSTLCHNNKVPWNNCLSYAVENYGLCLGEDCGPDEIDERLRPGLYVTVDDILKRFVHDVETEEIRKHPVVFFDDAFTPRMWWHQGGIWRKLYIASKYFDQFYRDYTNVLILTAPDLSYFTDNYIVNSMVLTFTARVDKETGRPITLATHFEFPFYSAMHYGKPYLFRVRTLDFVDKVIKRRGYGMPKWLEQAITERRKYVMKESLKESAEAMKNSSNGGGE